MGEFHHSSGNVTGNVEQRKAKTFSPPHTDTTSWHFVYFLQACSPCWFMSLELSQQVAWLAFFFFFKRHIVSCGFPQLPQIAYYRPTRRGTKIVPLCYSGFLPWRWVVFKAGQQPEPHCSLTGMTVSIFGFQLQYLECDNMGRLYKPLRTEIG